MKTLLRVLPILASAWIFTSCATRSTPDTKPVVGVVITSAGESRDGGRSLPLKLTIAKARYPTDYYCDVHLAIRVNDKLLEFNTTGRSKGTTSEAEMAERSRDARSNARKDAVSELFNQLTSQ